MFNDCKKISFDCFDPVDKPLLIDGTNRVGNFGFVARQFDFGIYSNFRKSHDKLFNGRTVI